MAFHYGGSELPLFKEAIFERVSYNSEVFPIIDWNMRLRSKAVRY